MFFISEKYRTVLIGSTGESALLDLRNRNTNDGAPSMDQLLAWTALHWMLAKRDRARLRADDAFYERELWRMPGSRPLLDDFWSRPRRKR